MVTTAVSQFLPFIELIHRIREACGEDGASCGFCLHRHFFEFFPVFRVWGLKDERFDGLSVFWAADSHFKAWEVVTSDVVYYGLDALMPSRTASLGNANPGKWKVQIVVYNKHSVHFYPEVLEHLTDCFAAFVHVSKRLRKKNFSPLGDRKTPGGTKLALHHCRQIMGDQPVNDLKSHIVPSVFVLFSRIAKADKGKDLLFVAAEITHIQ